MLTQAGWERLVAGVWADLAITHGILADAPPPGSGADIVLSGPDLQRTAFDVKRFTRPVSPSVMRRLASAFSTRAVDPEVRLLVIAPAASQDARSVAAELGASLLVTPEGALATGVLRPAKGPAWTVPKAQPLPAQGRARGRVPWGTYAVAFCLLEAPARDQRDLATRVGISRPRVSQVLTQLGDLVAHCGDGWSPTNSLSLARWLADRYPRVPLMATSWATLEPPVRAAELVSRHLDGAGMPHAVSGDAAADLIAPWARPASTWLWCQAPFDLQPAGLTPAPGEAATVTLAVSEDPYLLSSARRIGDGLPLLPGWRVWVDLVHQGHQDGADGLADALLAGRAR